MIQILCQYFLICDIGNWEFLFFQTPYKLPFANEEGRAFSKPQWNQSCPVIPSSTGSKGDEICPEHKPLQLVSSIDHIERCSCRKQRASDKDAW